jgi:UTP--glucose-1-phosphate uridylyltransferase
MKMITKAVIPAAGYGTRFLPITKSLPKELLPIIDRPTIEFIVNEAIQSGITDILLIVSSNKNTIIDYFDYNIELETILLTKEKIKEYETIRHVAEGANIHYIRQKEQLGLGHAVLQAKAFIGDEPFAVLLGDDIYMTKGTPVTKQLIEAHRSSGHSVLGTIRVKPEDTGKYGICIPKGDPSGPLVPLAGVIEKPEPKDAPSRLAIGGRYVLDPAIFKYLENQERGVGGEIQLTDAIRRMMESRPVDALEITGKRYDIGNKVDYIEAILDVGLEDPDIKDALKNMIRTK